VRNGQAGWVGFGRKPKMTMKQVARYRMRHADGESMTALAEEAGVSLATMSRALRGVIPSFPLEAR
jgi:hypothetical protein